MGHGRAGRAYVPDETGGGVYHIEEGQLCHTPMLPDGRIEWGSSAAVSFATIEPDYAASARAAGRLLCRQLGFSPAFAAELTEDREGGAEPFPWPSSWRLPSQEGQP